MQLTFDRKSVASYEQFLQLRKSPVYHFRGNAAIVPDEYAAQFGLPVDVAQTTYRPIKETFGILRSGSQESRKGQPRNFI